MKMSFRIPILLVAFLLVQMSVFGQKSSNFFYDTLVVMDYTTNMASERLSQMRTPIQRTFFMKSGQLSYTLFNGNVSNLTADQVFEVMNNGFNLYFDKEEYKGHENLKPSTMEILNVENEVIESIESVWKVEEAVLRRKMAVGTKIRLSGFIVSVNEEKHGPIQMDIQIVE